MRTNILIALPVWALMLVAVVFLTKYHYRLAKSWHIDGIVTYIDYNTQQTPCVTVDSVTYSLTEFNCKASDSIFIGDSVYKEAEDLNLYHYKINSNNNYYLHNTYSID